MRLDSRKDHHIAVDAAAAVTTVANLTSHGGYDGRASSQWYQPLASTALQRMKQHQQRRQEHSSPDICLLHRWVEPVNTDRRGAVTFSVAVEGYQAITEVPAGRLLGFSPWLDINDKKRYSQKHAIAVGGGRCIAHKYGLIQSED